MSLYRDNMETISDVNTLVPEGAYSFRISKVEEKTDEDSGAIRIAITCKIQTEGPSFGETVFLNAGLEKFGLRVLKTLYDKTGYAPSSEGHDPEQLVDREFRGTVIHKAYQGNTYANISPQSIDSIY